jgi:ABC-2 type transport system permease protein
VTTEREATPGAADERQAAPGEAAGRIFDLGYQHYEGAREGRRRAMIAIWRDSMRGTVGLGRSTAIKVLAYATIFLALFPAIFIVVVAGFISSFGDAAELDEFIGDLSNRGYYRFAIWPLTLFVAILGPELLCPDRRSGTIVLYLVRPLRPRDYLAARWAGFFTVTMAILLLPQLMVFVAIGFTSTDVFGWLRDNADILPRAVASGAVVGLVLTTVSLAIASMTDRRAYAVAGVVATVLITWAISDAGVNLTSGRTADFFELIRFGGALQVNDWMFDAFDGELPAMAYALTSALLVLGGSAFMLGRYRRISL